MFKNKFKAFLIHFLLSITIVTFIIGLVIYFWYPLEYLGLTRFKTVALLVISVDLVMGPVLTFVVFNPNKKNLRFDLAVIAILQFSALGYGVYTLFQGHPVYITFNQDRFTLVQASDAKPEEAKYNEYQVSKLTSGTIAFAKMPEDAKEQEKLLFDAMDGAPDLDQRTDYYEPYEKHIDSVLAKKLDPELIFSEKNLRPESKSFLSKHADKIDGYAFLPLSSSSNFAIIVLDKESGKPVDTIGIDPWDLALQQLK